MLDLNSYFIGQSLDYGFMVAYGSGFFAIALIISRKFEENTKWRNTGYFAALAAIIAACLDACENAFILLTLTDPTGFPDAWAIAHSSFALLKWIFLMFAIMWALSAALYYLLVVKRRQ